MSGRKPSRKQTVFAHSFLSAPWLLASLRDRLWRLERSLSRSCDGDHCCLTPKAKLSSLATVCEQSKKIQE